MQGLTTSVRAAAFAAVALSAFPVAAQTFVDTSGSTLKPADQAGFLAVLKKVLDDPGSAQIRNLLPGPPGFYCGEYDARGQSGISPGFRLFAIDLTKQQFLTAAMGQDADQRTQILNSIAKLCKF